MEAAFQVFAEHGIAAATIDEIAETAGFTKGAFYSNFASKEELFLLVTERYYRELLGSIRERSEQDLVSAIPTGEISVDTLGPLILGMMRSLQSERSQQLLQIEATQLALRDVSLRARYVEVRNKARDELGRVLGLGVSRMRRRLLVSEGQAIRLLLNVYEGCLTDLLLEGVDEATIAERLHGPMATVLLGITTPDESREL